MKRAGKQILFWLLVFAVNYLLALNQFANSQALNRTLFGIGLIIPVVYLNYLYLAPRFMLSKQYGRYLLSIVAVVVGSVFIYSMVYRWGYLFFDFGIAEQAVLNVSRSPTRFITTVTLVKMVFLVTLSDVYLYYRWQQKPLDLIRYKKEDFLTVANGSKELPIDLKKLILIEGQREYVKLHFEESKSEMILYALKKLEEELPGHFLRVHKSFIVNMEKAERLNANELKVTGQTIPIGKTYRASMDDYFSLKAQVRLS
jgi:hypothetical protein